MTPQKAIDRARKVLTTLQADLMTLTMHIGETMMTLNQAELALEGGNLDEQKQKLQAVLDACPKFDPADEPEPVRDGENE